MLALSRACLTRVVMRNAGEGVRVAVAVLGPARRVLQADASRVSGGDFIIIHSSRGQMDRSRWRRRRGMGEGKRKRKGLLFTVGIRSEVFCFHEM